MYDKSISELKRAVELSRGTPEYVAELGYVYARSGNAKQAREILSQLETLRKQGQASAYSLAVVYAGIGDNARTLQLLRQAVEEHAAGTVQLKVSPLFKNLRGEPAFQDILRKLALSDDKSDHSGQPRRSYHASQVPQTSVPPGKTTTM